MTTPHLAAVALLLCATTAVALADSPKPAPPKTFEIDAVDAFLAAWPLDGTVSGLSVAIVRDGKLVFVKGYGKTSLDGGPVAAETAFSIGSVTKQFVCAAALLLVEDGKLALEDPVAKFYPGLTRAGSITVRQLMNHTSGYPDFYPLDFVDRRLAKPTSADAIIDEYARGKLDFEPGTRWSYTNTAYTILGRIIEKASGEPLAAFLDRRLFQPLEMGNSGLDLADPPTRGALAFALGSAEPAVPEGPGWLYAAGGIWAPARDVARWDLGLMTGSILRPESFRAMTTPTILADGRVRDYGLGLNISRRDGDTVLTHGGAISGFRAYNSLIPRTRSAVVVLSNGEGDDASEVHRALVSLLLKDEAPSNVPKIDGPKPDDVARDFLRQMQAGRVDRGQLSEEFSAYLDDKRLADAAPKLKALGEPKAVEILSVGERGGMEVASLRLTFETTTLSGLLYRSPDGKIHQLLFNPD